MFWVILVLLVVVLLLPLTFPLEVEIDTKKNLYRAQWRGVLGFWAYPAAEKWRWFYRILFFEREWQTGPSKPKPPKPKKEPAHIRRPSVSARQAWHIAKNLIKAIRLKHLRVEWDTDDYVLNAKLYPAFQLLSRGKRQLRINFLGKQELALLLQTRPVLLIWAVLKVFFHPKYK